MTDPRDRIRSARTLATAPPSGHRSLMSSRPVSTSSPPPPTVRSRPRRRDQTDDLIGKPQGTMRCVGLFLPAPTRAALYEFSRQHRLTLGEAFVAMLGATIDELRPADQRVDRFGPRAPGKSRKNLEDPRTVYVLLTPNEAVAVRAVADDLRTTVSALATLAIDCHDHLNAHTL